ncbi:MAG: hypothetical protein Q9164_001459 [Protoblastenia rupestris]
MILTYFTPALTTTDRLESKALYKSEIALPQPAAGVAFSLNRDLCSFTSGTSASVVLADEAPNIPHTPFISDHPANSTSHNILFPDTSALYLRDSLARRNPRSHLDPSPPVNQVQRTTVSGITPARTDTQSRRRRRSPSTSSDETSGPEDLPWESSQEQESGTRAASLADNSRHRREAPSAPKRRRLMTQDMRHELPIASNSSNRHVNGSSHSPQKNGITNGTNGHTSPTNGMPSPRTNGFAPFKAKRRTPDFYGHDREEVTRLLIQGLEDLGYEAAAERLSQESGYQIESPAVAAFRHSILEGSWSEVQALLFGRNAEPDGGGVSISNGSTHHHTGLKLVEDADLDQMKFLIREQKYLELLKRGERVKAIVVLQTELQPLNYDIGRLNMLSGQVSPSVVLAMHTQGLEKEYRELI